MNTRSSPLYTDFTFISTKLRGMRSLLFEGDRLKDLLRSRGLSDLSRQIFPSHEFAQVSPFQKKLISSHISQLFHATRYFDSKEKHLLEWRIFRFAMENLKVVFRGWLQKKEENEVRSFLVEEPFSSAVNLTYLLSSASADEFVSRIPWEEIREGAEQGLPFYNETEKPYFIESGIERAYHLEKERLVLALRRRHRKTVLPLTSLERNFYNLLFVLRARFHYDLQQKDFAPFLLPDEGALKEDWVPQIIQSPGLNEALSHLPSLFTGPWSSLVSGDVGVLENLLWSNLYRQANRTFYFDFPSMGSVVAFFLLKRIELSNLIKISEAIRYGLTPVQCQNELIPVPLSGFTPTS